MKTTTPPHARCATRTATGCAALRAEIRAERTTLRVAFALLALTLAAAGPASSQGGPGDPAAPAAPGAPAWPAPPPDGLALRVGLEPHLVVSVGYLWGLDGLGAGPRGAGMEDSVRVEPYRVGVGVGVKVAPYLLGDGAGRLNLTVASAWRSGQGPWGAAGTADLYLVRSRNRAATAHGLGMEVRVAPGYHGERWALAADLGWQATVLSHVRHGEAAREAFEERYPEADAAGEGPVDGWYGVTSQRFRIGVLTTRRLRDGLDLQLAAGSLFSRQRQGILFGFAHGQVPAYLEATMRWAR